MRYFNTEGLCDPALHYMVKLDDRLEQIKRFYIDEGKYFVINKGRQYGKTTTLYALEDYLKEEYLVVPMDFQGISTAEYRDEYVFSKAFLRTFSEALEECETAETIEIMLAVLENQAENTMGEMFSLLSKLCKISPKPIVVMIDEVDSAANNEVFIDFLAQLRRYYLKRRKESTFHSVILAGVYYLKNLKLRIRPEEERQYNSPWNIAASFDIDMDFSAAQIAGMLFEYETDHKTGMNVEGIAEEIYQYTSGYPYLVSAICKFIDGKMVSESGSAVWTKEGILRAVKYILNENSPLFGSMIRHINEYPVMRRMLYDILFCGETVSYNPDNQVIELAKMFGYIREQEGRIQVANRIFETRLYDYYLSEEELTNALGSFSTQDKSQFMKDNRLDMKRVLSKFVEHFTDIYGDNDEKFIEDYGRKFFLLYLKPIINGTGNYYIEAQTRNAGRTDVIVDYLGEQFIVELKIWHGNEYHKRGEQQLTEYLDYYHQDKGYLLSFNFNKKKEVGVKEIRIGNKTIVEAVV